MLLLKVNTLQCLCLFLVCGHSYNYMSHICFQPVIRIYDIPDDTFESDEDNDEDDDDDDDDESDDDDSHDEKDK